MLTFQNDLIVDAPLETVWDAFADIPAVARCVPGATVTGQRENDVYEGQVQVKVGAVGMTYRGTLTVTQRDASAHRLSLTGKAAERSGGGNLSSEIVCTLEPDGAGTHVHLTTHVNVTGRAAGFGRGIMESVAATQIQKFGACLEAHLSGT